LPMDKDTATFGHSGIRLIAYRFLGNIFLT